jgi:TRAP-type mannitol/chloroaromatic compound transport system permease small subunit
MEWAWRGVAAIARVAIWCGGAMLLAAAVIVSAEVFTRKGLGPLFGPGLVFSGSDEISAYLFAVGTSWSLAHALVTRGHVRIDALYSRFGPRSQILLDLLALIGLGLFLAALLERAWDLAFSSWMTELRSNTPLRIPLAWAQLPWFGGIALFALTLVLAVLRTLLALMRGDFATAAATSGAITQDEEIESELESLGLSKETPGQRR